MIKTASGDSLFVSGISSLIRTLDILTDDLTKLDEAIYNGDFREINAAINLHLVCRASHLEVGDLVLFSPVSDGAYNTMETTWGSYVTLEERLWYIGVISERGSGKLLSSVVPFDLHSHDSRLHVISGAGGIGIPTGSSSAIANKGRPRHATPVSIAGAIWNIDLQLKLNIGMRSGVNLATDSESRKPLVFVLGTGTDTGKSTTTACLIRAFGAVRCAAGKAAGTGGYEDLGTYAEAGANVVLDFTALGAPSTYGLRPSEMRDLTRKLICELSTPHFLADQYVHPDRRGFDKATDVVFLEFGGDLMSAGIPDVLSDSNIMQHVAAIILCNDGAISVYGALKLLGAILVGKMPEIIVNVPQGNPQMFYERVNSFEFPSISGFLDVSKATVAETLRTELYANAHSSIWDVSECATFLRSLWEK